MVREKKGVSLYRKFAERGKYILHRIMSPLLGWGGVEVGGFNEHFYFEYDQRPAQLNVRFHSERS